MQTEPMTQPLTISPSIRKVKIPFHDEFRDRMIAGTKTFTTRTKAYGHAGDVFETFGHAFLIRKVFRAKLRYVATLLFQAEGFNCLSEFMDCWKKLYPRKGYQPDQKVYVHYFTMLR